MVELGIPFSDPVADGTAIQAADLRALNAQVTPEIALDVLSLFRSRYAEVPVGMLLYANLVQRPGHGRFYRRLAKAGADSILVADLPPEEAAPFLQAASASGVGQVFMATPGMGEKRLNTVITADCPYIYVVSRSGVTGRDRTLSTTSGALLRRISAHRGARSLLGFGISQPGHVKQALKAGADGTISGSAVAEIIAGHCGPGGSPPPIRRRRRLLADVEGFVSRMKRATRFS